MMRVVCSWCGLEIEWREGPPGETTHGICPVCKEREMKNLPRPFSVQQRVALAVGFVVWLLLSGWAGERDRQDAEAYQRVKREIAASAHVWAVTR